MKNSKETRLVPPLASVIVVAVVLIVIVIFSTAIVGTADGDAGFDCVDVCLVDQ